MPNKRSSRVRQPSESLYNNYTLEFNSYNNNSKSIPIKLPLPPNDIAKSQRPRSKPIKSGTRPSSKSSSMSDMFFLPNPPYQLASRKSDEPSKNNNSLNFFTVPPNQIASRKSNEPSKNNNSLNFFTVPPNQPASRKSNEPSKNNSFINFFIVPPNQPERPKPSIKSYKKNVIQQHRQKTPKNEGPSTRPKIKNK